uniref:Uncharacterized protein n=1 Tax=Anguilla anguilla TaxID=7936 RepID=A0A0E9PW89_ANGAN
MLHLTFNVRCHTLRIVLHSVLYSLRCVSSLKDVWQYYMNLT